MKKILMFELGNMYNDTLQGILALDNITKGKKQPLKERFDFDGGTLAMAFVALAVITSIGNTLLEEI